MDDKSKSSQSDSPDKSATEATDKGKLDALLAHIKEFDEGTQQKASTATKGKDSSELESLRKEVARLQGIEADRSYRREMDEYMIPTIQAELEVHPKLVEAWLNEQAEKDSALRKVWEGRDDDRAAFEEAVKGLVPKFEAYAEKEGITGTAGKNLKGKPDADLQAALRNSRSTRSDSGGVKTEDLGDLSDTNFELRKQEIFRLAKAGQLQ